MNVKIHHTLVDQIRAQYQQEELIILESQHPVHPSSKKTFIAIKARNKMVARGDKITLTHGGVENRFTMNPWEALKLFRDENSGWLFGYLGYDLKNYTEDLSSANSPLQNLPDLCFIEPETVLKIENGQLSVLCGGDHHHLPGSEPEEDQTAADYLFEPAISRDEYFSTVQKIKKKIKDGDFYELNYTYPLTGRFLKPPYWLYRRMRDVNPVPFAAYLKLADFEVCCSSPERFLKKEGGNIISEPIKGTAERLDEDHLDINNRNALLNEKNRAENLMIVDLVRHDFSRVCKTGSVKVTKLYDVQSFGTVHQLISTVEGEVKEGQHEVDVIKNCFPMGSMTGAPKIEVMNQIDELENYSRGIYSGAIGYFTPERDFDFNVVIRTAIIQDELLVYPVGGAITSDSNPDEEWNETIIKAKNLTNVFSGNLNLTK